MKLPLALAALLAAGYSRASICKAAHDSYTIAELTTGAPWTNTRACRKAVSSVGAPRLDYVWIQGETDMAAPVGYQAKLAAMFVAIRTAVVVPVRFYVLLLNPSNAFVETQYESIRAQQRAAVDADEDAALIDADDLKTHLGSYLDHYDSGQEIEIGNRVVELEAVTP